jgi:hypothetical protein
MTEDTKGAKKSGLIFGLADIGARSRERIDFFSLSGSGSGWQGVKFLNPIAFLLPPDFEKPSRGALSPCMVRRGGRGLRLQQQKWVGVSCASF